MTQTEALKHEINLVLTDPDTNLSHGAKRALDYVLGQLEALAQPEQEPAAKYTGETWCGSVVNLYEDIPLNTLLYTTPPQRTWVGLTDEEFVYFCSYVQSNVLLEIESKLKEKNA